MNIMVNFKQLAEQYKGELLDKVLPFWLDHSQDHEFGGYFSCLNRDGSVYDQTSSFGCKVVRCGCSPCFTTK